MAQRAPPLAWIEAFVAAARAGTFRQAGEMLALSPSAFSRRIQNLEGYLESTLFVRGQRRVILTPAGQKYLSAIEPAMDALGRATRDFREPRTDAALRIRSPHSFAISWLMPRLAKFLARTPGADVEITIGRGLDELRAGNVDAIISNGPADLHGFPSEKLLDLDAVIVSAPVLAQGQSPPRHLEDLNSYRVLLVPQAPHLWQDWTQRAGLEGAKPVAVKQYETLVMMYEAACAGLGITLGLPLLTERCFAEGRLQPCVTGSRPTGFWYSLVYASDSVSRRPEMRVFRDWLLQEVAESCAGFQRVIHEAVPQSQRIGHASH